MRWFVALAAAGGAVILSTCDPAVTHIYPVCPFRWLTGLYCPVCGSLRGLHELLHGHPLAAARCNALMMAALAYLAAAAVGRLLRAAPPLPAPPTSRWRVAALCALIVGFAIVRNLEPSWPLRP